MTKDHRKFLTGNPGKFFSGGGSVTGDPGKFFSGGSVNFSIDDRGPRKILFRGGR